MSNIGKWAFFGGLVLAVVASFVSSAILPWIVGGLGVVVGLLNVTAREVRPFLLAAIGLTLALFVIERQSFNPPQLTETVFFVRVFVSHALLAVGFLQVLKTARD